MENMCRLCADNKTAEELLYHIDDETLNIKQKLIVCCQWNSLSIEEHNEMPKWICGNCFESLSASWAFANNVAVAQNKIQTIVVDIKPLVLLEIEKLDIPLPEHRYVFKEEIHELIESHQMKSSSENNFIDSISLGQIENDMNVNISEIEECKQTNVDCDLLAVLLEADKNVDGTVKKQKITELNLDDWSILKSYCKICNRLFDKLRTLRSHFKLTHPDKPLRIHCTFCNASSGRKTHMYRHIVNIHRSYLKFW